VSAANRPEHDWRWHIAEAERLLLRAETASDRWRGQGSELAYRAQVHLQLAEMMRATGMQSSRHL
jgi:hypothetical protein